MEISGKGIELIKKFEGCELTAYKCPAGVWTIGYGHTTGVKRGQTIAKEDAEKLLKEDLILHSNNVEKLVKVPLKQNQFDALVSFEYNVGFYKFKNSTLLKLLNQKKYKEASAQFKAWKYGGGRVLMGLVKRRSAEEELFMS